MTFKSGNGRPGWITFALPKLIQKKIKENIKKYPLYIREIWDKLTKYYEHIYTYLIYPLCHVAHSCPYLANMTATWRQERAELHRLITKSSADLSTTTVDGPSAAVSNVSVGVDLDAPLGSAETGSYRQGSPFPLYTKV